MIRARDLGTRYWNIEPDANVIVETDPLLKTDDRSMQADTQTRMVAIGGVFEWDSVHRERSCFRNKSDPVFLRILPDGAVRGSNETVPKCRLNTTLLEELSNTLQTVNGLL